MPLISISIKDDGANWSKEIRLAGLLIYRRHDFTKTIENRQIGFNSGQYCPGEIYDDYYYPEEMERK